MTFNNFRYKKDEFDTEVTILSCTKRLFPIEIVIPDTIEGLPVRHIAKNFIKEKTEIFSVTLPDTVISIGESAFEDCEGLCTVNMPKSLETVADRAFFGCKSIEKIEFFSSLVSIGNSTFEGCSSIKEVTLSDTLTSIGNRAFYGCESMRICDLPKSLSVMGEEAFYGCSALERTTIPSTLKVIPKYAFVDCQSLKDVSFEEGIEEIGVAAFSTSGIANAYIPESVTHIRHDAFRNCHNLSVFSLPDNIQSFESYALGHTELDHFVFSQKFLDSYADEDIDEFFELLFNSGVHTREVLLRLPTKE